MSCYRRELLRSSVPEDLNLPSTYPVTSQTERSSSPYLTLREQPSSRVRLNVFGIHYTGGKGTVRTTFKGDTSLRTTQRNLTLHGRSNGTCHFLLTCVATQVVRPLHGPNVPNYECVNFFYYTSGLISSLIDLPFPFRHSPRTLSLPGTSNTKKSECPLTGDGTGHEEDKGGRPASGTRICLWCRVPRAPGLPLGVRP